MYANTDSDTYATVTNSQTGTTSYYIYIKGFNFDDLPAAAEVTSFTVKLKARESGASTSSSYAPKLCNNTSQLTSTCSAIGTTATTYTFTGVSADWDEISGYGADFGIRINCRRNSRNTTAYVYIYGAEILVEYSVPNPRTITSTLTGNGSISPSGNTTTYDGEEFMLTIMPTNSSDEVTLKHNDVDVTSSLEFHTGSGEITAVPSEEFQTGFSTSDCNFYQSSSTTSTSWLEYAIGHSAESPYSTSNTSNTYVKNSNNTGTGYIAYNFDFSSIPADAIIDDVEVRVYGARENATTDSTHVAQFQTFSGNTAKGTLQNFTSTSNSKVTVTNPGTWTRDELQNAILRFTVGYYGGRMLGISWDVTFHLPNNYYTYTFTVSGNATLAVTIGSAASVFVKINNAWVEAAAVYKKINNSWVQQSDLSSVFDPTINYVKE